MDFAAKHAGYRMFRCKIVENKATRKVVKMAPIGVKTLKRYTRFATTKVGAMIAAEMGDSFSLMFDGWTSHSLHFLGL